MNELTISKTNFEKELAKVRKINIPSVPNIEQVAEDGELLRFTDHNVTGKELNNCIVGIRKSFIHTNNAIISIRHEFEDVYNTFDALDKQYIEGIVASLNSANSALDKVSKAQEDIQDTVNKLKMTVEKLKEIKGQTWNRISSIENLCANVDKGLSSNNERVNDMEEKTLGLEQSVNSMEHLLSGKIQDVCDKQSKDTQKFEEFSTQMEKRVSRLTNTIGVSLVGNIILLALFVILLVLFVLNILNII